MVETMTRRRSGLRKQVTEVREGPLEPGRERGKENMPGEEGGKGPGVLHGDGLGPRVLRLEGIHLEVSGGFQ